MRRYTVYQFSLSRAARDAVNSVGWTEAQAQFPEVKIQQLVKFQGSEGFSAWMSEYYTPVAHIDAPNLDAVFHIGNVGTGLQLQRLGPMHSVSVGDVILDRTDGTYHMVDSYGFTQLLSFTEQAAA